MTTSRTSGDMPRSSAVKLLALQQPVASDLRKIVGSLHVGADIERMGALAVHVANIARMRHPDHALARRRPRLVHRNGRRGSSARQDGAGGAAVTRPREGRAAAGEGRRRRHQAPASVHGADRPRVAQTASAPQSTSRCSAASTSGSPTTPSRSAGGWCSRPPAACPCTNSWPSSASPSQSPCCVPSPPRVSPRTRPRPARGRWSRPPSPPPPPPAAQPFSDR